jgi:hypothetical protein
MLTFLVIEHVSLAFVHQVDTELWASLCTYHFTLRKAVLLLLKPLLQARPKLRRQPVNGFYNFTSFLTHVTGRSE